MTKSGFFCKDSFEHNLCVVDISVGYSGNHTEMTDIHNEHTQVKEVVDLPISTPDTTPIVSNDSSLTIDKIPGRRTLDVTFYRSLFKEEEKPKRKPIRSGYNRKSKSYNKYKQEQRDEFLKLYKEHRKSYKASTYAELVNVPTSIIYSWMKMASEGGDLQYVKDRNDFHRVVTPEKIQYIGEIIDKGGENLTEKRLAEMMKEHFHMEKEVNQSTISRLLHSKLMKKVTGKTYSLKTTGKKDNSNSTPESSK